MSLSYSGLRHDRGNDHGRRTLGKLFTQTLLRESDAERAAGSVAREEECTVPSDYDEVHEVAGDGDSLRAFETEPPSPTDIEPGGGRPFLYQLPRGGAAQGRISKLTDA